MPTLCPTRSRAWKDVPDSYIGVDDTEPTTLLGGGPALSEMHNVWYKIREKLLLAASYQPETMREKFERLSMEWREDTAFLSSVQQMAMHPAYQEIIGMGPDAIPLILKDLERTQDHWSWALSAITGINSVCEEDRGIVSKMADSWLNWGRQAGYLQS